MLPSSRVRALTLAFATIQVATLIGPVSAIAQDRLCAVNPRSSGFSDATIAPDMRTVYVSGQVGVDATGRVVGDFRAQTEQAFKNVAAVLAQAGASFDHVVKTTIFLRDMSQLAVFREIRAKYVNMAAPPASTLVEVSGLVSPQLLVEIEAIAVLPTPVKCPGAP